MQLSGHPGHRAEYISNPWRRVFVVLNPPCSEYMVYGISALAFLDTKKTRKTYSVALRGAGIGEKSENAAGIFARRVEFLQQIPYWWAAEKGPSRQAAVALQ